MDTYLKKLMQITQSINKAQTDTQFLLALAQNAIEAGASWGSLWYVKQDVADKPYQLEMIAARRFDEKVKPLATPIPIEVRKSNFLKWLIAEKIAYHIEDIENDEKLDDNLKELHRVTDLRSSTIMPFFHADQWVGILLVSWHEPHACTEEETFIHQALLDFAAPIVANKRMVRFLEQKIEQQNATLDIRTALLNVSEARNRAIIDVIPDFIILLDAQGIERYVKHPRTATQNLSKEAMGSSIYEILPQDVAQLQMDAIQQVLASGVPTKLEYRIPYADGIHYYEGYMSKSGASEVLLFARDITERKLFEADLQRQNSYLSILHETTLGLISHMDLDGLLEVLTTRLGQLLNAPHTFIFLLNAAQTEMVFKVGAGAFQQLSDETITLGQGFIGTIWETNQPLIISDYDDWANRIPDFPRGIFRTSLGVPLQHGTSHQEVIGVLGLAFDTVVDQNLDEELALLQQFAQLAALVLSNVQLYETAQQERKIADTLREIGLMITSSLEQADIYQRILLEVQRVVPYDAASIWLYDEQGVSQMVAGSGYEKFPNPSMAKTLKFTPKDDPILREVIQTQKVIILRDTQADERWNLKSAMPWIRSWATAPILVNGKVIGQLNFDHSVANFYDKRYVPMLEALSAQVSIALEKAQFYQREAKRRQIAVGLTEVIRAISAFITFDQILEEALPLISAVIDFDSGSIALLENNELVMQACAGFAHPADILGKRLDLNKGTLTKSVLDSQQTLMLADAQAHSSWIPLDKSNELIRAWIGAPIVVQEKTIGLLTLDKNRIDFYTQDDVETASILASQLGIAIHKAQLFETSQRRAQEAETLREASAMIAGTLDSKQIIAHIMKQLYRVIPYTTTSVQLLRDGYVEIVGLEGWQEAETVLGMRFAIPGSNPNTQVIQTRQPVVIHNTDYSSHADIANALTTAVPFKSWLGVPLIVQDRVIGMITIDSNEPNYFQEDHIRLATAFANQVAITIQNATLYEEITRHAEATEIAHAEAEARARQLATLNRVTQVITSELELNQMLNAVAREMVLLFNARNSGIAVLDDGNTFLKVVADYSATPGYSTQGVEIPLENNIATQQVLQTRRSIVIAHAQTDERNPPETREMFRQLNMHCLMIVPLLARDRVLGTIGIDSTDPQRVFTDTELGFAETIAVQIVGAIEKAQLFEAERHQRQVADTLREISLALVGTFGLQELLRRILVQIQRLIDYDLASVWLVDETGIFRASVFVGTDYWHLLESESAPVLSFENTPVLVDVLHKKQVKVISDVLQDKDWVIWEEEKVAPKVRSWASAPLIVQDKVIGLLNLDYGKVGYYNEAHIPLLEALATQISVAFQNARLFDEVQHQRDAAEEARRMAEEANRAKSVFLANMSHELRTPMNAILGFAQIMQRDSFITPSQQQNLNIISRSGDYLLTLINDVLDQSKIEIGQVELRELGFDLHRLLKSLTELLLNRAEAKDLYLNVEMPDDLPRYFSGDQDKIRQILINLLGNAIKFTEEGGVILRVKYTTHPNDIELLFEVEDTGLGIPEADLTRVFEAFVQVENRRQSNEGTGLGLAISRRFIELMGGAIQVESKLGQGTIFKFNIRVKPATQNDLAEEENPRQVVGITPNQQSYRILVVEDKPENRLLLQQILMPVGFEVQEAENGAVGVSLAQSWQPHLIFMDMRMPIMDGYEATRLIKAAPQTCHIPVIALTASVFQDDRSAIFATGVDDFLPKPFRTHVIFDVLAKYLGVEFIYEEISDTPVKVVKPVEILTPEVLQALTPSWRLALHEAASTLDLKTMLIIVGEIQPHYPEIAEALGQLARDFDFETLIQLTETGVESP